MDSTKDLIEAGKGSPLGKKIRLPIKEGGRSVDIETLLSLCAELLAKADAVHIEFTFFDKKKET